jgi:hypothetical protein
MICVGSARRRARLCAAARFLRGGRSSVGGGVFRLTKDGAFFCARSACTWATLASNVAIRSSAVCSALCTSATNVRNAAFSARKRVISSASVMAAVYHTLSRGMSEHLRARKRRRRVIDRGVS